MTKTDYSQKSIHEIDDMSPEADLIKGQTLIDAVRVCPEGSIVERLDVALDRISQRLSIAERIIKKHNLFNIYEMFLRKIGM